MQFNASNRTLQNIVKNFTNVAEAWEMHDTVMVGINASSLQYSDGYFNSFAAMGAANDVPFFNVRNKNHGLPYNNQETRDALPYPLRIFSIGVQFFAPATACVQNSGGTPIAPQVATAAVWEADLVKNTAIVLQTNQDEVLKLNCQLAPPGVGPCGGGYAQGDMTNYSVQFPYPNVTKTTNTQGVAMLTNKWGFLNPLEIPRRVNVSAKIVMSEYARNLLGAMPGPFYQNMRSVANTGAYHFAQGLHGIRVFLGGQRLVQQRGQYHA